MYVLVVSVCACVDLAKVLEVTRREGYFER